MTNIGSRNRLNYVAMNSDKKMFVLGVVFLASVLALGLGASRLFEPFIGSLLVLVGTLGAVASFQIYKRRKKPSP